MEYNMYYCYLCIIWFYVFYNIFSLAFGLYIFCGFPQSFGMLQKHSPLIAYGQFVNN